jgi:hypothetical protein
MQKSCQVYFQVYFIDIPYKKEEDKDIYKFSRLIEAYTSKGYKVIVTENIDDIISISIKENINIVLFWHLSSSKYRGKIVKPDDINYITKTISTDFYKKFGVTDSPLHKQKAEETKWFSTVYSWAGFGHDFYKEN